MGPVRLWRALVACCAGLVMTAAFASHAQAQTLLAVGGYHTCVVTAGVPQCVGLDEEGESSTPGDLGPVIAISASVNHTCVIQEGGTPRCWGYAGWGATTIP